MAFHPIPDEFKANGPVDPLLMKVIEIVKIVLPKVRTARSAPVNRPTQAPFPVQESEAAFTEIAFLSLDPGKKVKLSRTGSPDDR
jgi:hypothetical protein